MVCCDEENNEDRDKKLISTFQIVRFPNDVCIGSNTRNGTCYTSAECSDKDGTSAGSCADGFGVCCTFVKTTCGSSTSENNTYWTQPTTTTGQSSCDLTVCPSSDDICRLRLDFTTFAITGPSTHTLTQTRRRLGVPSANIADDAGVSEGTNYQTNCFIDTFSVTGTSPSSTPPTICGTLAANTHMYVDADMDRCNKLVFTLGDGVGVTTTTRGLTTVVDGRTWDITVQQIECTSITLPPVGCTEYLWGSGKYTLQSYTYVTVALATFTGVHLANQHVRHCMRRERGMCVGCFSSVANGLNLSGTPPTTAAPGVAVQNTISYAGGCCGYVTEMDGMLGATPANTGLAAAAMTQAGWDCIIIPGAFTITDIAVIYTPDAAQTAAELVQTSLVLTTAMPAPPQLCGNGSGIGPGAATLAIAAGQVAGAVTIGNALNVSICTRHVPFMLEFMSDDLEGLGSTLDNSESRNALAGGNQGYNIDFAEIACV